MWAIYAFLHSFLAASSTKQKVQSFSKSAFRYYRLSYNLFAILGLLGIIIWGAVIPDPRLWPKNNLLAFISLMLATYGVIVIRLSFKQYPWPVFMGITAPPDQGQQELKTGGLLKYIRHPIYAGTLLLIFGFALFAPTLTNIIHALCITIYILIGIRLEETKLIAEFGATYLEYQKQVPMLMPKLPWRR